MPRRPTRTVPTLLLYGWGGSGPGHWQRLLADELTAAGREVRFPEFPNPDEPELEAWLSTLTEALDGLGDDGFDVLAHSLGAVLWLHHVHRSHSSPRPARVALVAPPSPEIDEAAIASFFPVPMEIDAVRAGADGTVLVGGDADPHCPEGIAAAYARPLKMAATVIEGGGHLNVESGFGAWPAVSNWCGRDNLAFF
ncbi:hypothetical protein SAMN05444157_3291 [Frankineae bacterium MT45]|nr:hypothetical protein SAMN05444157_3291 [Frankineae bacterium MT45]